GPGDETAEKRQRVADEVPEALHAPGRGVDLPQVLLGRLRLQQQAFDAGDIERDVTVAPIEPVRPGDEAEPVAVVAQQARRLGTLPRETRDHRAQQLALVRPRRRLRLQSWNEDDPWCRQGSGFERANRKMYSRVRSRHNLSRPRRGSGPRSAGAEDASCVICIRWCASAIWRSPWISTAASSA